MCGLKSKALAHKLDAKYGKISESAYFYGKILIFVLIAKDQIQFKLEADVSVWYLKKPFVVKMIVQCSICF